LYIRTKTRMILPYTPEQRTIPRALWPGRHGRRRPHEAAPPDLPDPDRAPFPRRRPLPVALALGALAGGVGGFVFALRAGVLIGPAVALVLWHGIPSRHLLLAAGALLTVVVPALYLLVPARDRGGYSTTYANERLTPHWATVAAVALLATALVRQLAVSRATARRDARAAGPPGAGAPPAAP